MKVIKNGYDYPRKFTCDKCQSELEFEMDDVKLLLSADKGILSSNLKHVTAFLCLTCPVCGKGHLLDSADFYLEYAVNYPLDCSRYYVSYKVRDPFKDETLIKQCKLEDKLRKVRFDEEGRING